MNTLRLILDFILPSTFPPQVATCWFIQHGCPRSSSVIWFPCRYWEFGEGKIALFYCSCALSSRTSHYCRKQDWQCVSILGHSVLLFPSFSLFLCMCPTGKWTEFTSGGYFKGSRRGIYQSLSLSHEHTYKHKHTQNNTHSYWPVISIAAAWNRNSFRGVKKPHFLLQLGI